MCSVGVPSFSSVGDGGSSLAQAVGRSRSEVGGAMS